MYCTKCGSKIKENGKFCTSCGAPVKKFEKAEKPKEVKKEGILEENDKKETKVVEEKKETKTTKKTKNTEKGKKEEKVEDKKEELEEEKVEEKKEEVKEEKIEEKKEEVKSVVTSTPSVVSTPVTNVKSSNKKGNSKLFVIIGALCGVIVLLVAALVFFTGDGEASFSEKSSSGSGNSRTIMMYISGNDLESRGNIVSADLSAINPSKIDLKNTNVLIYVGGTKNWHNQYINSNENAIFLLKENGFEKIETYSKNSMGDYRQFRDYLNYVYKNYKADSMDLILYDHGGAIDGAVYDEFTGDNLSLMDLRKAFSESKFSSRNKLNTVLFRTCLNGTLEVASVLSPYVNYMIASEEVTYGAPTSNVLSFLNNVTVSDTSIDYGKKFITRYSAQMDEIDPFETITKTYSIIDLSKIDKVNKALNEFSSELKPKDNYALIAKTRSNLFQYASSATNIYDMVDLYSLSDKLSILSNNKAKKLKNAIKDAVVYNWGNSSESNGISVYFPFKADNAYKNRFLSVYKQLGYTDEYYDFISDVYKIQNSSSSYAYSFNLNDNEFEVTEKKNKKEFSVKLTDEQVENYARASYLILKKEDNDYYTPIYGGRDAELGSDNVLRSNISDNLFAVYDPSDGSEEYVLAFQDKKKGQYEVSAVLQNYGDELEDFDTRAANLIVNVDKNNKVKLSQIIPTVDKDDDLVQGLTLKLEDYKSIQFTRFQYKVLDSDGNFTLDWEGNSTFHLWEVTDKEGLKESSFELRRKSLDESTGEYYCVFMITDIKNNTIYSKLVKIDD